MSPYSGADWVFFFRASAPKLKRRNTMKTAGGVSAFGDMIL